MTHILDERWELCGFARDGRRWDRGRGRFRRESLKTVKRVSVSPRGDAAFYSERLLAVNVLRDPLLKLLGARGRGVKR